MTTKIALSLVSIITALLLSACSSTPIEEVPSPANAEAGRSPAPEQAPALNAVAPATKGTAELSLQGPGLAERLVYFDYDSSSIKPEYRLVIEAHARYLGSGPAKTVTIAGHTDERGGREYNLALGQQRAETISRALQLLGVRSSQIETISFGEEKPSGSGAGETAWSRNRRAELSYR